MRALPAAGRDRRQPGRKDAPSPRAGGGWATGSLWAPQPSGPNLPQLLSSLGAQVAWGPDLKPGTSFPKEQQGLTQRKTHEVSLASPSAAHLSLHPPICPSTHSSCASVCPSFYPSVCPCALPSSHPSVSLPIHPSVHPSIHPSIRLSFHPSIHPSIHSLNRCLWSLHSAPGAVLGPGRGGAAGEKRGSSSS